MSQPLPEIEAPDHPQALIAPPPEPASAPPKSELPKQQTDQPKSRPSRIWLWAAILAALLLIAFFWYRGGNSAPPAQKGAAGKNGKGAGAPPIPVVTAQAEKGNIGVYVTGLGAITPIATVTVKSRVDGQLMAVHFREGEYVKAGDPLIEIDPRPYQAVLLQTEGTLARDEALLANAKVDVKRYQTLLQQDAIPEQQLATQQATEKQYEGTVKNDQGLVDAARLNVNYCHITSPISGIVGLRLVDPGNIVHAADANGMLVITQLQPISVIFTVSEDQLPPILQKLHANQKLTVEAWDRQLKNKIADGALDTVDNEIDQTTGTLKIRAIFANQDRSLYPNQFVNARLLLQEKMGVTLLPSAAIQRNTNSTYVYLVKPGNTVTVRQIMVGTTEGENSEITSGLQPGDQVVMTGVDKLQEGSRVTPHLQGAASANQAATKEAAHKSQGPGQTGAK